MALVDVEGPRVKAPPVAAPPVLRDPAMPAFDEGYAYNTFSPAMGGASSSAGPRGGTIDWSYGTDPNGYRPVYRPDGSMYWYRPEDGAVWEATPASRAGDQAIAAVNRGGAAQIPITNAPVIRQNVPSTSGIKVTPRNGMPAVQPKPPVPPGLRDVDAGAAPSPPPPPGLNDINSRAPSAVAPLGPTPFYLAKPGAPSQPEPRVAEPPPYYLAKPGMPSQPAPVDPAVPKRNDTDVEWVPPDPNGRTTQEREGYWRFVEQMPSSGYSDWGFANDLVQSALPESVIKPLGAGVAGPLAYIPGIDEHATGFGENLVRNTTSPLGAAGFLAGGPVSNIAAEIGAAGVQTITDRTNLPGYVETPLIIGAGVLGGVGGGLREGAEQGIRHSVDDAADALATSRARNPVRPGMAPVAPAPPTIARQLDDILNPAPVRDPVVDFGPDDPFAPYVPAAAPDDVISIAPGPAWDEVAGARAPVTPPAAADPLPAGFFRRTRGVGAPMTPAPAGAPEVPELPVRVVGPERQAFNGEITAGGTVRPAEAPPPKTLGERLKEAGVGEPRMEPPGASLPRSAPVIRPYQDTLVDTFERRGIEFAYDDEGLPVIVDRVRAQELVDELPSLESRLMTHREKGDWAQPDPNKYFAGDNMRGTTATGMRQVQGTGGSGAVSAERAAERLASRTMISEADPALWDDVLERYRIWDVLDGNPEAEVRDLLRLHFPDARVPEPASAASRAPRTNKRAFQSGIILGDRIATKYLGAEWSPHAASLELLNEAERLNFEATWKPNAIAKAAINRLKEIAGDLERKGIEYGQPAPRVVSEGSARPAPVAGVAQAPGGTSLRPTGTEGGSVSAAAAAPVSELDADLATLLELSAANARAGQNIRVRYVDPEGQPPKFYAVDKRTGQVVGTNVDVSKPRSGNLMTYDPRTGNPISAKTPRSRLRPLNEAEQAALRPESGPPPVAMTSEPAVVTATNRAAADTLHPQELERLEALETATREQIGRTGIEETLPPGYESPWANSLVEQGQQAGMEGIPQPRTPQPRTPTRPERVKGKVGRGVVEAANAPRTLKANLDLSFVRRQGGALNVGDLPLFLRHPKRMYNIYLQEQKALWQSLRSPENARRRQQEIIANGVAKKRSDKLYIAPLDGDVPLNMREEAMIGSFITKGKWNPLRLTSNANIAYLNTLREQRYDMIVDGWNASGKPVTPGEADFVANFINHATGRGTAKWLDDMAPALSIAMFSPRYTVSRFQLLTDPLFAPTWRTRWMATRVAGANLGMQAAMALGIGLLLKQAGVDYEIDPRSTDFGRIKAKTPLGTVVVDTTSGMNAPIRFVTQLGLSGTNWAGWTDIPNYKSATGFAKNRPAWETTLRFLRSKASPIGGETLDWFFQQIPGLQDLAYGNERGGLGSLPGLRDIPYARDVANMLAPISLDNAVRYFQTAGSPATYAMAAGLALAEIFGDSGDFRGLTDWEKRDKEIASDPEFLKWKKAGVDNVRGYDDLNEAGQLRARQKYPVEAFSSGAKLRAEQKEWAGQERDNKLQGVEDILRNSHDPGYSGKHQYTSKPGKSARDAVKDIQLQYAAQLDLIYREAGEQPPGVVQDWRKVVEENTWPDGLTVDWDAVEKWEASLPEARRRELDQYFEVAGAGKSGIVKEIADAKKAIGDSQFWDTDTNAWQQVKDSGRFPEADMYADIYEYKREWVSSYAQANGVSKEDAGKEFDKLPIVKAYESQKEREVLQWVLDNPETAKTAARWDYYTPTDTTRGFLATGDPDEVVTRTQQIDTTSAIARVQVTTGAGTSGYEDVSKTAWKTYADTLDLRAADGRRGSEFNDPAAFKEAGGAVPDEYTGSVSGADYEANPSLYIRVPSVTEKGNPTSLYIAPAGKAEVEAIASLWKQNPDLVREAFRLDLPGFRVGDGGNLNKAEVIWLRSQGVEVPE